MEPIVAGLNVVDNLSIDKISGDLIEARVVPWSEEFLAVK